MKVACSEQQVLTAVRYPMAMKLVEFKLLFPAQYPIIMLQPRLAMVVLLPIQISQTEFTQ